MLYLIKVGRVSNGLELLKIGYTNNIEQRLNQYKSHNPLCEIIATREGDGVLEDLFHFRYHDHLFHGKEWFRYAEEIVDGFKTLDSDQLVEYIWNHKSSFKTGELIFKNPVYIEYSKDKVSSVIQTFKSITLYEDRMKFCCDYIKKHPDDTEFISSLPPKYAEPLMKLSIEFIEGVWYKYYDISEQLKYINSFPLRKTLVLKTFQVGEKYLVKNIKLILQSIYEALGFRRKKAKATDLEEYFEIKLIQMIDPESKRRVSGYKIISLK